MWVVLTSMYSLLTIQIENLPTLVRLNFNGQIYPLAADLTELCCWFGKIWYLNKAIKARHGRGRLTGCLYTCKACNGHHGRFVTPSPSITGDIELTFAPPVCCWSAAAAVFKINDQGVQKSLLLYRRHNFPKLPGAWWSATFTTCWFAVTESTYGGRSTRRIKQLSKHWLK